jgi:hypothetical protein
VLSGCISECGRGLDSDVREMPLAIQMPYHSLCDGRTRDRKSMMAKSVEGEEGVPGASLGLPSVLFCVAP